MDVDRLLEAAAFRPARLAAPSWVGHIPFASWLIRTVAPATFVELGTHSGTSYLAFCQAVKEAGLRTKCYAVDTWRGDEHSGGYDEQVFAELRRYHDPAYAAFSRLLRMTFDEAAASFGERSVDLLHIDGLHTYEAVRHDFETWLPKLVPGALVLFHDTNVREREFGVYNFWAELCLRYPRHLEFRHSNGLGVLQLGDGEAGRLDWLEPDSPAQKLVVDYFASLGAYALDSYDVQRLTADLAEEKRKRVGRRIKAYVNKIRGRRTPHA